MIEPKAGYVPSLADFEDMAREMHRDHVLFEGRLIQGRVVNGAFVAGRLEDQQALDERTRESMKNYGTSGL